MQHGCKPRADGHSAHSTPCGNSKGRQAAHPDDMSYGTVFADRFLPDKAIDLVDEAAARLKMEATSKPEVLDEIERKVNKTQIIA
jgi:AAA lid domain